MNLLVLGLLLFAACCGGAAGPSEPAAAQPTAEVQATARRHLIYLHGRIVEDQGPRPTHPRFGIYEYRQILDAFAAAGFEVSSEQRPAGTRAPDAALVAASEIRQLIDRGVPARDITVVGFSKGGVIAVLTALELDNPEINFVFIACCGSWVENVFGDPDRRISGRMLSIYEASDTAGSCSALFERASPASTTEEIELGLGGGHGAFYRPQPEWIDPVIRWARGQDPRS
jgi:hypothetical protein